MLYIRGGMMYDVICGFFVLFIDKVYLYIYIYYIECGVDFEFFVKFWVKKYNILYVYVIVSC